MKKTLHVLATATLLVLTQLVPARAAPAAKLTVQADRPGHTVPRTLWGIFFEDINLSADGGIYPEMVRNRSFEDSEKPEHWTLTNAGAGQSEMATDTSKPLNPINRRSLRVQLNGSAELRNEGYWGMNFVQGEACQVRLAARAADGFTGPLTVTLEDQSGHELATGEVNGLTGRWQWFSLDLTPAASNPKGRLRIGASGQGALWLDMVSVLPRKTWKSHGLRPDLCEMLAGLKPGFVRFPGGCWVEGDDCAHMYRWKDTIGDVAHRKPLWNIWGYYATHGLGYHEYLQLSEDLGAEPLFCINVGMSHKETVPLDQMGQWVQDALDAIEYANGPTNTIWGSLRARNGHPAPFNLKYLEIGNENGGPAYRERWALFYDAIKARHPEIQLIANVWSGYPTNPMPDIVDEHYYNNPEFFMRQAHRYDTYDRSGPKVFVGEFAVTRGCGKGNLRGAIGEAAFMTGLERNSDVVIMAAYAPLLVNVNHRKWNPDLINFDSARVYGLPSYYVQQLFAEHRGDRVLPVKVDSPEAAGSLVGGTIGVGTWQTKAEFKDIKVTHNGQTLYAWDFADGTKGWKFLDGSWSVEGGALRQPSLESNIRAIVPGQRWTNYTYSLKARKLGGAEGFLILFNVANEDAKSWWNIGGWGNDHHALEMAGVSSREVKGHIESDRWYDIRVEVSARQVKCFLDGQLIHDTAVPVIQSLYASATRAHASGETIVKVVNAAAEPLEAEVVLEGAKRVVGPAKVIVLTSAEPTDENTLESPTKVAPVTQGLELDRPTFTHRFPGNSLTVLRVRTE